MTIIPFLIDEDKTKEVYDNEFGRQLFESYPAYYYKTGYNPPWIGYLVFRDSILVGVGGFTGQPKNGRVEIAYGTRKEYEGQGIASFTCQQLISISKTTDPKIVITAKTAPENNASVSILKRNGFTYTGVVQDEEIGDAWEWVLDPEFN
jgi:ribosomal-protein-alanine N-acetyltransferase